MFSWIFFFLDFHVLIIMKLRISSWPNDLLIQKKVERCYPSILWHDYLKNVLLINNMLSFLTTWFCLRLIFHLCFCLFNMGPSLRAQIHIQSVSSSPFSLNIYFGAKGNSRKWFKDIFFRMDGKYWNLDIVYSIHANNRLY